MDWPPFCTEPIVEPCALCGKALVLLLQAFAPLDTCDERYLYIFGCNSSQCSRTSSTWRVFRIRAHPGCEADAEPVRCSTERDQSHALVGGETLRPETFSMYECDSDDDSATSDLEDLLKLHKLQIDGKKPAERTGRGHRSPAAETAEVDLPSRSGTAVAAADVLCSRRKSDNHESLPTVHIEVDYEPQKNSDMGVTQNRIDDLLSSYNAQTESDDDVRWNPEQEDLVDPNKEAEEAFRERVARAPTQVLRYLRCGTPVWPSASLESHAPPPCICGAKRVFELQIMSTALHYLSPDHCNAGAAAPAGMNWACIAIYTCADDCAPHRAGTYVSAFTEHVVIEPDGFEGKS